MEQEVTSVPVGPKGLLELAERCERAEGPAPELNDAIADALFTGKHRTCIKGLSDEAGGMWMFRYPDGSIGSALRFTASIDAALTLVPEGWTVAQLGESDRKGWWAELRRGHRSSYDATAFGNQLENRTPALALCAAALRARAAAPTAGE